MASPMKAIKCLLAALLGAALATLICWGAVYLYGVFVLHGHGSLFDTNPSLANTFFITWGGVSILCAVFGCWLAVLGSQMKRIGLSVAFFIVGLLTTWAAMLAGSQVPPRFKVKLVHHVFSGCYEIGPRSVSWWATALLATYLLGPSLIFAATGWISSRPGIAISKQLGRLSALIVITALLYIAGYAISG